MVYVALLRGINVGGKNMVEMAKLKATFESLGFVQVRTYINSGNVIFRAEDDDETALRGRVEPAIARDFSLDVPLVLRSLPQMQKLVRSIPKTWMNDAQMRCDVMLLRPEVDAPAILENIPHKPAIEDLVYFPGAVVWRIDRVNVRRGQVINIIGTDTYKQLTIRNVNTVRKLLALMKAV